MTVQVRAEDVLQRPSLEGVRTFVQGLGHVGMSLAERLVQEERSVVVAADVRDEEAQETAVVLLVDVAPAADR